MNAKDQRIKELETIVSSQAKLIEELRSLIEDLRAEVADLKRRLKLDSSNSSKPPSSDGLRKPSTKSLREKTNKKFGGQEGHQGDTLKQVDNPDEIIEHHVDVCSSCGASLASVAIEEEIERQEFDIEFTKKVRSHRSFIKRCSCGTRNSGMPKHMTAPAQYGPEIRAFGIYLSQQFLSKERSAELFREVFGISISDTTLMQFDSDCASNLVPFYDDAYAAIMRSEVAHFDETSARVMGKTNWAHVSGTEEVTHYRISKKRGDIPQDFSGIAVHDHFVSYNKMTNAQHAFCNAHHLRELKAIFEVDGDIWAHDMYILLKDASKIVELSSEKFISICAKYDEIIKDALELYEQPAIRNLRYKRKPGHNLALRLSKYKSETLRFLCDSRVPFTNNLAERDLRMVKLKQKVSGCFRSDNGAKDFVITRSFISTIRKQHKPVYVHLKEAIAKPSSFNNLFDG